ncbi:MAG: hypothetical protein HQL56_06940, partial [Magnetococcales bacterium]|nr:hypothetical protein [Magnetococcales bacterium]
IDAENKAKEQRQYFEGMGLLNAGQNAAALERTNAEIAGRREVQGLSNAGALERTNAEVAGRREVQGLSNAGALERVREETAVKDKDRTSKNFDIAMQRTSVETTDPVTGGKSRSVNPVLLEEAMHALGTPLPEGSFRQTREAADRERANALPSRDLMSQAEQEARHQMGWKDWIPFVEPDPAETRRRATEMRDMGLLAVKEGAPPPGKATQPEAAAMVAEKPGAKLIGKKGDKGVWQNPDGTRFLK